MPLICNNNFSTNMLLYTERSIGVYYIWKKNSKIVKNGDISKIFVPKSVSTNSKKIRKNPSVRPSVRHVIFQRDNLKTK